MTKAAKARHFVRNRDKVCAAIKHDPRCRQVGYHVHHICYRRHIVDAAMWLVDNLVLLSGPCHELAHKTHNGNISAERKKRAVTAVNAVVPENKPELRHKPFEDAA